jgi:predicted MPP superfamily phosphohydrolase
MSSGEMVHLGAVAGLFLGASLGHLILCVYSHNWWYGSALGRKAMDGVQWLHGLAVLAGPITFWWLFGFDLLAAWRSSSLGALQWAAATYIVVCWAACFVVLPVVTAWRCLRPRPEALLEEQSNVVDVTARLGHFPLGRGKQRHLARLPFNQVFQVDCSERTLRLPRLPAAWDGMTLLHLSDFHFCGTPDAAFYEWILEHCSAEPPDLVAFTGDLIDEEEHLEWVRPVFGKLRWKAAAIGILGNHDHWFEADVIRSELSAAGLKVVSNSWTRVEVRGEPLVVIGSEYPWLRPAPELDDCPAEPFRLLLSHTPDNIAWARRHHVDLMLCGHVHGGQIRLPMLGSVVVPSQYGRRYDGGVFHEPPTVLHVSRGLGGEHPLRFNCRPEITRLTLQCGQ